MEVTIKKFLNDNREGDKAQFDKKLIPTKYEILGIRTKVLEDFSKVLAKENVRISQMPLSNHEEILLAGMVLAKSKMPQKEKVEDFKILLNYIDNWATCDMIVARLKGLESEGDFFINLLSSDEVYKVRVGIIWVMKFMLKKDVVKALSLLKDRIKVKDYYIDMALAWCYAEALIYDFDFVINFVQKIDNENVKKIAYSKACDSFRISDSQKYFIRNLRKNQIKK